VLHGVYYNYTAHLQEGLWAHYVNNGSVNGMLEYYNCPPGYCQCRSIDETSEVCNNIYSYGDENFQCVCDRKGTNVTIALICLKVAFL